MGEHDSQVPGTKPDGYKQAIEELESIIAELENDELDVDSLAERVRRASELLVFCRTRIFETRLEIDRVISELDVPEEPAPSVPDSDPWQEPPG